MTICHNLPLHQITILVTYPLTHNKYVNKDIKIQLYSVIMQNRRELYFIELAILFSPFAAAHSSAKVAVSLIR